MRPVFRPRRLGADIIIAGPEVYVSHVQQWTTAYEEVAPDVLIDYVSIPRDQALAMLYEEREDAVADVVLLGTPASERELAAGLEQQDSWFCQDCGQHWQADEFWFRCTSASCRHEALARYNTATVVAQIAVRTLLKHNQHQDQNTTADGTASDHTALA
jgi:hypothetical protein